MRFLALLSAILFLLWACEERDPYAPGPPRPMHAGLELGQLDPLENQYFLKRYRGVIGNEYEFVMLMIHWGNGKITGQHVFPKYGEFHDFYGTVAEDGTFNFTELRFKKDNAFFGGRFEDSLTTMKGIWWNMDSTSAMPFEFHEVPSNEDYDGWTGAWHLNDPWDTCILMIGDVTDRHFDFALSVYINDYREEIYGTANIYGQRAVMDRRLMREYEENCRISFYRKQDRIVIDMETFPFLCGLGANCWLDGSYDDTYTGKEALITYGTDLKTDIFRTQEQYEIFLDLVGAENCRKFAYNMERLERHKIKSENDSINAIAYQARVRGFHREKEGIIMYDDAGYIWAATTTPPVIDWGPMSVHYFSNHPQWQDSMPQAIKDWMAYFTNCLLIYETKDFYHFVTPHLHNNSPLKIHH